MILPVKHAGRAKRFQDCAKISIGRSHPKAPRSELQEWTQWCTNMTSTSRARIHAICDLVQHLIFVVLHISDVDRMECDSWIHMSYIAMKFCFYTDPNLKNSPRGSLNVIRGLRIVEQNFAWIAEEGKVFLNVMDRSKGH